MDSKVVTAEELLHVEGHCDLVRGKVRALNPPSFPHARIAARICTLLSNHVHAERLGVVLVGDAGFLLESDPDTVLGPDVAFVRTGRLHLEPKRGYSHGPPDLAVEVRSRSDSRRAIKTKAEAWLRFGCRLVLTVDPPTRSVTRYVPTAYPRRFALDDSIDLGEVVPGLVLEVAAIFGD